MISREVVSHAGGCFCHLQSCNLHLCQKWRLKGSIWVHQALAVGILCALMVCLQCGLTRWDVGDNSIELQWDFDLFLRELYGMCQAVRLVG
jgi:hypothetical protein